MGTREPVNSRTRNTEWRSGIPLFIRFLELQPDCKPKEYLRLKHVENHPSLFACSISYSTIFCTSSDLNG